MERAAIDTGRERDIREKYKRVRARLYSDPQHLADVKYVIAALSIPEVAQEAERRGTFRRFLQYEKATGTGSHGDAGIDPSTVLAHDVEVRVTVAMPQVMVGAEDVTPEAPTAGPQWRLRGVSEVMPDAGDVDVKKIPVSIISYDGGPMDQKAKNGQIVDDLQHAPFQQEINSLWIVMILPEYVNPAS